MTGEKQVTHYYVCSKCGTTCDVYLSRSRITLTTTLSLCCKAVVRVEAAKD